MFTIIIKVDSAGVFQDIEFENAPKHIPINVREEVERQQESV